MNRILSIIFIVLLLLGSIGCASNSPNRNSPYATPSNGLRDPQKAQTLTLRAAELLESDPEKVKELLQEALTADIHHGPAHNNLGVYWLSQNALYEAANEFEWARKLMPGHPDPRMNLAFTLERAGRVDEALANYESALEVYPNHIATMQALTRLQIRRRRPDDRTSEMLKEIALAGETAEWREWAKYQRTLR